MKRINYILLLAAAMMTSGCANDEVIDNSANVEMKFRVTADNPTRAANAFCNNNMPTEFTLSCDVNGLQLPLFAYERMTKNGDYWEFADNQNNYYWAFDTYYNYEFYATNAQKPSTLPIKSTDSFDGYDENEDGYHFIKNFFNNSFKTKRHIIHTVPTNASAQTDLLIAHTNKNISDVTNGVVTLNFAHLLSKVVFYAKVTDQKLLVQIDEVKVCNVFTKGRFQMEGRSTSFTDGNFENHTTTGTAPTYLDELDTNWYASGSYQSTSDSQHSVVGTHTTGTFSLKKAPADASGVGTAVNLSDDTETAEGHTSSTNIANTLMLIPQVTTAWNPATYTTPDAGGQAGSYFLVKCRIWDVKSPGVWVDPTSDKTNGSVELWPNTGVTTEYIAIPFAASWKAGRKYVYTFVFGNSGGFGGYDPTTGNKVLLPIKLDVSVHEFVEVGVPGTLDR